MTAEQVAGLGPAFTEFLSTFRSCFPRRESFGCNRQGSQPLDVPNRDFTRLAGFSPRQKMPPAAKSSAV